MKPMAPWSEIKVNESPACEHTIWDYFGLLCIKQDKQIKKVWVCIFTCITVRAIHFELVEHYVRNTEKKISDNAPQFKAMNNIIDIWENVEVG